MGHSVLKWYAWMSFCKGPDKPSEHCLDFRTDGLPTPNLSCFFRDTNSIFYKDGPPSVNKGSC